MTLPIELRRARKSDIPFITSSWLKSNRYGYLPQSIPNTVYYHQHHKILEEVIPRSVVLVAILVGVDLRRVGDADLLRRLQQIHDDNGNVDGGCGI